MAPQSSDALIDDLLAKLEDMERSHCLAKIHQLENEAATLNNEIYQTSRRLSSTTRLFNKTIKLLRIFIAVTEAFDGRRSNAEHAWGQYWGIYQDTEDAVFPMESLTP